MMTQILICLEFSDSDTDESWFESVEDFFDNVNSKTSTDKLQKAIDRCLPPGTSKGNTKMKMIRQLWDYTGGE